MKIKRVLKQLFSRGNVNTSLTNSSKPLINGKILEKGSRSLDFSWVHGFLFELFSTFAESMMYLFIHICAFQYGLPAGSVAIIYFVTTAPIAILYICVRLKSRDIPFGLRQWATLAIQAMIESTSGFLIFMALRRLPLGVVATIAYTYPVISMVIFAILLRMSFNFLDFLVAVMCAAGVIFVSLPQVFQSNGIPDASSISFGSTELGAFYAILAAVLRAFGYYLNRILGSKVHFSFKILSYSVGLGFISFFFGGLGNIWEIFLNMKGVLAAVIGCLFGFLSQSIGSLALKRIAIGPSLLIRSVSLPLSYILGIVFLKENISIRTLIGTVLITASSAVVGSFWKTRNRRK